MSAEIIVVEEVDWEKSPEIHRKVCSILAGYAWDTNNPCVKESQKHLKSLSEVCRDIG